ncbi:FMRFamide-related neuropeptide [Zootermopsis nevadensis]|uniref:FMRFamide-related neuropeptide n=1 Tax=Zootermopsis nevadensis TaxID=136037 RepID=A0A067QN89_ZOONE|nr:FMRFamide-related neuropeptide [Zootermopsis nevadensis]
MKLSCSMIFLLALLLALLVDCNTGPPHRRVPFNGSMYGKRTANSLSVDYDSNAKSLSSLCEVATEVCSAWFPQQTENN